jgi:hypothetical protein
MTDKRVFITTCLDCVNVSLFFLRTFLSPYTHHCLSRYFLTGISPTLSPASRGPNVLHTISTVVVSYDISLYHNCVIQNKNRSELKIQGSANEC